MPEERWKRRVLGGSLEEGTRGLDDQEYEEYWRPTADGGNLQTQDIGVGLKLQEFILYTFNSILAYLRSRI